MKSNRFSRLFTAFCMIIIYYHYFEQDVDDRILTFYCQVERIVYKKYNRYNLSRHIYYLELSRLQNEN